MQYSTLIAQLRQQIALALALLFTACLAGPARANPLENALAALQITTSALSGKSRFLFTPSARMRHSLADDMTAALELKSFSANQHPGSWGGSIGVSYERDVLGHADLWRETTGENYDRVDVPKLRMQLGLPFDTTIGAAAFRNRATGLGVFGFELSREIFADAMAPHDLKLAARASYSMVQGVKGLSFSTRSLGLILSHSAGRTTPYAGIAYIQGDGSYSHASITPVVFTSQLVRAFVGTDVRIMANLHVTPEIGTNGRSYYGGFSLSQHW